ncbi:Ribonuclease VapC43 [subsurface metagenome]
MILPDVNVFVYAFRKDLDRHTQYKKWLENALAHEPTFGFSEIVLSSFIRIVTHPKIFVKPSSLEEAFGFIDFIRSRRNSVAVTSGTRHWSIFSELCKKVDAKGNLITDAYLAAIAIENGCEWITTDRDFARFPGFRWRHPLKSD